MVISQQYNSMAQPRPFWNDQYARQIFQNYVDPCKHIQPFTCNNFLFITDYLYGVKSKSIC